MLSWEDMRADIGDLLDVRPGRIVRVSNVTQLHSTPIRLNAPPVNCEGCGAPQSVLARECEYCRRPR